MEEQNIEAKAYHIITLLFHFYKGNQSKNNQNDLAELLSVIRKLSSPIDLVSNPINANLLIKEFYSHRLLHS